MILAILLLLSGLAISGVAIYYSVVGLTAIFAAAAVPIMIMGISLEVGKLVIASWVKAYWDRIPWLMRTYAVTGVAILMIITSLGIFGFLSKAHSDQTLVTGDIGSKIAIYDEKIKTARENIEADRRQLKQMDEAVDQIMGRSSDEKGADKANAVRRSQQRDRIAIARDIETQQKLISGLNEESAPIRAENRKVEAEVGPIKYIAAFIYGTNPDSSILEKAVTWVIILIVIVFDPLAVVMLLAAQMTWQWYKRDQNPPVVAELDSGTEPEPENTIDDQIDDIDELGNCHKCNTPLQTAPGIGPYCPNKECDVLDGPHEPDGVPIVFNTDYLDKPFVHFTDLKPMPAPAPEPEPKLETTPFEVVAEADTTVPVDVVHQPEPDPLLQELATELEKLLEEKETLLYQQHNLDQTINELEASRNELAQRITQLEEANQQPDPGFVYQPKAPEPITDFPELQEIIKKGLEDGTLTIMGQDETVSGPSMEPTPPEPEVVEVHAEVIPDVERPGDYITDPVENLFKRKPNAGFGAEFPDNPVRGDMFLRTDFKPTRLFKWNDIKWIEVNKSTTDAYSYNDAYIQYLATKLSSGEYQFDDLTEAEQMQVQTVMGGRRG